VKKIIEQVPWAKKILQTKMYQKQSGLKARSGTSQNYVFCKEHFVKFAVGIAFNWFCLGRGSCLECHVVAGGAPLSLCCLGHGFALARSPSLAGGLDEYLGKLEGMTEALGQPTLIIWGYLKEMLCRPVIPIFFTQVRPSTIQAGTRRSILLRGKFS
jgi:hypothetical protein